MDTRGGNEPQCQADRASRPSPRRVSSRLELAQLGGHITAAGTAKPPPASGAVHARTVEAKLRRELDEQKALVDTHRVQVQREEEKCEAAILQSAQHKKNLQESTETVTLLRGELYRAKTEVPSPESSHYQRLYVHFSRELELSPHGQAMRGRIPSPNLSLIHI